MEASATDCAACIGCHPANARVLLRMRRYMRPSLQSSVTELLYGHFAQHLTPPPIRACARCHAADLIITTTRVRRGLLQFARPHHQLYH